MTAAPAPGERSDGRRTSAGGRVGAIAWREFKYTALTRAFILGAIVFPLFVWSSFPLIIMLTKSSEPPLAGTIAIVDPDGAVGAAARVAFDAARHPADAAFDAARLAQDVRQDPAGALGELAADPESAISFAGDGPSLEVAIESYGGPGEVPADVEELKQGVRAATYVALVVVDPAVLEVPGADGTAPAEAAPSVEPGAVPRPSLELFTAGNLHPSHVRALRRKLGDAVLRARAERRGEDLAALQALLRRPPVEVRTLAEDGGERGDTSELREAMPYFFVALLAVCAFTSSQYLLTTTIEEKSNRVMEVLLSAASPLQLMTGKVLGQGLVSVVMLIMYGGLLVTGVTIFGSFVLKPHVLALFGAYFVIAYFVTAATMAAVGSAVSDIHDAQSLMLPAMALLLFAPMLLMFPASQNPGGVVATVASFVPPVLPYVMVVRLTAAEVPPVQIVASLVVGFASMGGALWLAARVFRVGVLMYGKPPTPLELIRWVRYS